MTMRTYHPGLAFQHLCFGTAGAKGCEAIGRRGVGWGSAGLAPRVGVKAGTCVGEQLALVWLCPGASSSNRWVLVVAPLWTSSSPAPPQPLLLSPLF